MRVGLEMIATVPADAPSERTVSGQHLFTKTGPLYPFLERAGRRT